MIEVFFFEKRAGSEWVAVGKDWLSKEAIESWKSFFEKANGYKVRISSRLVALPKKGEAK